MTRGQGDPGSRYAEIARQRLDRTAASRATFTASKAATDKAASDLTSRVRSTLVALRRRAEDRRNGWGLKPVEDVFAFGPEDDELPVDGRTPGVTPLTRPPDQPDDQGEHGDRSWLR